MINTVVKAKVDNTSNFGAFCTVETNGKIYKGLIHISELANEFVRNVEDIVKPGQDVEALILSVDEDKNQMKLSLKRVG